MSTPESRQDAADDDPIGDALRAQAEIEEAAKVPKTYKAQYAAFLKTPDTGIARLLPAESVIVVDANKPADKRKDKPIPTECSFFAFHSKLHQRDDADLRFTAGRLKTGMANDSYGVIKALDETPLDGLTAESAEAATMLKPVLPKTMKEVRAMMDDAVTEAEPAAKKTFLLRTAHSRGTDMLIAFQVVATEPDGGVIILWKRLYKGKAPEFKNKD